MGSLESEMTSFGALGVASLVASLLRQGATKAEDGPTTACRETRQNRLRARRRWKQDSCQAADILGASIINLSACLIIQKLQCCAVSLVFGLTKP